MSVDELLWRGLSIEEVWRRLGAANPQELGKLLGIKRNPKRVCPRLTQCFPTSATSRNPHAVASRHIREETLSKEATRTARRWTRREITPREPTLDSLRGYGVLPDNRRSAG